MERIGINVNKDQGREEDLINKINEIKNSKRIRVDQETYEKFVVAMKNVFRDNSIKPSKNFLKREMVNPSSVVGCATCGSSRGTLHNYHESIVNPKVKYCKSHLPVGKS